MRIDIIHMRDPDYSCDHEVWVDGVKVGSLDLAGPHSAADTDIEFYDFDPGAGSDMAEFEEQKTDAVEAAPDYLKDRIAQIYDDMKPTYEKWSYDA